MEFDDRIQVGELVTVKRDPCYGLAVNLFEDAGRQDKTIHPWDNTAIKKGTIGLVLDFVSQEKLFLKVLWTIDGDSLVLYVRLNDLQLLEYDV